MKGYHDYKWFVNSLISLINAKSLCFKSCYVLIDSRMVFYDILRFHSFRIRLESLLMSYTISSQFHPISPVPMILKKSQWISPQTGLISDVISHRFLTAPSNTASYTLDLSPLDSPSDRSKRRETSAGSRMLVLGLLLGYDARPVRAHIEVHGEGSRAPVAGPMVRMTAGRVLGAEAALERAIVTESTETNFYWITGGSYSTLAPPRPTRIYIKHWHGTLSIFQLGSLLVSFRLRCRCFVCCL